MDLLPRALSCTHQASTPCNLHHRSARQLIYPTSSFIEQKGQPNVISTKAPSSDYEKFCVSNWCKETKVSLWSDQEEKENQGSTFHVLLLRQSESFDTC